MTTGREVQQAVPMTASSLDGRRFLFEGDLDGLDLLAGGYVSISQQHLGQVHTLQLGSTPSGSSVAVGGGSILGGPVAPFHAAPMEQASREGMSAYLEQTRPGGASLDVGRLNLEPWARFHLDARGFDRHTFFCGQSGSGKTYALGTVLERLLLHTRLRIVVLDPNSDFVRLAHLRADAPAEVAGSYAGVADRIEVRRGGEAGPGRLHVRFTECDADEQAAVLSLDPIKDREEYGVLVEALERAATNRPEMEQVLHALLESIDPYERALGMRMRNLGILRWHIWSGTDQGSLQDLVAPGGPRCLVVDLGSLGTPGEQALAAESVLAQLWRLRAQRDPVLVVIDEAHNVCPREPADDVTRLSTELAARFAAEGRKFGLYLLVSTQRPQRVNELVVSQCDNLVLMRMNAAGDLDYLARTLSFAPRPLLEQSAEFNQGEAVVAGKITSHPALVKFGPRWAEEGGLDVPTSWVDE